MKRLYFLLTVLTMFFWASCKNENVSPVVSTSTEDLVEPTRLPFEWGKQAYEKWKASDNIYRMPTNARLSWTSLPDSFMIPGFNRFKPYNQGGWGSCVGHATSMQLNGVLYNAHYLRDPLAANLASWYGSRRTWTVGLNYTSWDGSAWASDVYWGFQNKGYLYNTQWSVNNGPNGRLNSDANRPSKADSTKAAGYRKTRLRWHYLPMVSKTFGGSTWGVIDSVAMFNALLSIRPVTVASTTYGDWNFTYIPGTATPNPGVKYAEIQMLGGYQRTATSSGFYGILPPWSASYGGSHEYVVWGYNKKARFHRANGRVDKAPGVLIENSWGQNYGVAEVWVNGIKYLLPGYKWVELSFLTSPNCFEATIIDSLGIANGRDY